VNNGPIYETRGLNDPNKRLGWWTLNILEVTKMDTSSLVIFIVHTLTNNIFAIGVLDSLETCAVQLPPFSNNHTLFSRRTRPYIGRTDQPKQQRRQACASASTLHHLVDGVIYNIRGGAYLQTDASPYVESPAVLDLASPRRKRDRSTFAYRCRGCRGRRCRSGDRARRGASGTTR
jgi:hypothetical protein